jgi:PIN domain nuclease of toxin-antitoxin system
MPIVKKLEQHKLLLDTHVWIWLMNEDLKLSSNFLKAVDRCQKQDTILISAISIWEIGMLVEKKRIELNMDCLDWVERSLSLSGIVLVPISPRIAIQSTRLPGVIHGDPADRILIATAVEESAVLATHDQKLLDYGTGKFLSMHDPIAQKA